MDRDPSALDRRAAYQLLIGCIVPRPIGWITSLSSAGVVNLAPFSFFNGVSSSPPIVMVAVGPRRSGPKDTRVNIEATREFVVNLVTPPLAEKMVLTSREFPPDVSELAEAKLAAAPSAKVKPPRVADSPVHLECVLHRLVDVEATALILGRVVHVHVDDRVVTDGLVDPRKLEVVGRLGADWYCRVGNPFEIPRT
jgi:flavin reductase (DIM6/NTAB) family NADH-FMN oxidoreductase RutF